MSRQGFIIEGVKIAQATFGAFSIYDLMELEFPDYELIIEELGKKNA